MKIAWKCAIVLFYGVLIMRIAEGLRSTPMNLFEGDCKKCVMAQKCDGTLLCHGTLFHQEKRYMIYAGMVKLCLSVHNLKNRHEASYIL